MNLKANLYIGSLEIHDHKADHKADHKSFSAHEDKLPWCHFPRLR